jgi:putative serine protease PepD
VAALVIVLALALGGGYPRTPSTAPASTTTPAVSSPTTSGHAKAVANTAPSATQIYERDSAGVVSITARTPEGVDEGTGFVLNETGLILTNDHVVAGASAIQIGVGSGSSKTTREAKLLGEEANSDVALIQVNPSGLGLKALKLGDTSTMRVGDQVYAIGNPYGLEETFTRGIVSALNREIQAPDGARISGAAQTDAALNPGNSGGPLLNTQGEVVGVNSQIASDQSSQGGQPGSTGVGFAISTATVKQAVASIEGGNGVSSSASRERLEARRGAAGSEEGANESQEHRQVPAEEGEAGDRVVIVP